MTKSKNVTLTRSITNKLATNTLSVVVTQSRSTFPILLQGKSVVARHAKYTDLVIDNSFSTLDSRSLECICVTVPLGLWMFERPGELRLNHSNVIFNYFY